MTMRGHPTSPMMDDERVADGVPVARLSDAPSSGLPVIAVLVAGTGGPSGTGGLRVLKLPVILVTSRWAELFEALGDGLAPAMDGYAAGELEALLAELTGPATALATDAVLPPDTHRFGRNEVDLRHRVLWHQGVESRLTTHEAALLAYFLDHPGEEVSRDQLLQRVWGYPRGMATRTVDCQIVKLRKKIEDDPTDPRHILTVHGTGYRFEM